MSSGAAEVGLEKETAFLRALYYRFLSRAFSYPRAGAADALRREIPPAETAEGWGAAAEAVKAALEAVRARIVKITDAELESAHLSVFGHTVSDKWPPHETRYGSTHTFQESQDLADIAAFYEVFGLRVKGGTGERQDHISLELEFEHFLAVKELVARDKGDEDGAAVTLDAAKKFYRDHVGRWAPVFGDLLSLGAPAALTRELGTLLATVVRADKDLLGVVPGKVSSQPIPLPPEPEAEDEDGEGDEEAGE